MTVNKTALAAFFLLFSVVPSSAQTQNNIFNHASSYVGLHERSNRTQIKTVTKVDPVRTPWCAAFVNGILAQVGMKGTGSNLAISFTKYKTATSNPVKGDIVVIRTGRSRRGRAGNHVGIFEKFVGNRVAVLGGNQSNKVKVSYFSKSSVISYRKVA
jgi:uncharacterized protein (TIGR02594 family)